MLAAALCFLLTHRPTKRRLAWKFSGSPPAPISIPNYCGFDEFTGVPEKQSTTKNKGTSASELFRLGGALVLPASQIHEEDLRQNWRTLVRSASPPESWIPNPWQLNSLHSLPELIDWYWLAKNAATLLACHWNLPQEYDLAPRRSSRSCRRGRGSRGSACRPRGPGSCWGSWPWGPWSAAPAPDTKKRARGPFGQNTKRLVLGLPDPPPFRCHGW